MPSTPYQLLIADEDHEIRELIAGLLASEYASRLKVHFASSGREVVKKINEMTFDLAIVTWNISELAKQELFSEIRKVKSAAELPILVLVSSADPELIVTVLESGASEVLAKPFDRFQLLRSVKSFLRFLVEESPDKITWGDLVLDTRTQDVYHRSDRIRLTPSEFKLIRALIEHRGAVLTRDQLIELVQGEGIAVIDRAVDTHIFSVRKKLGEFGEMIQTVRGTGYRIKEL